MVVFLFTHEVLAMVSLLRVACPALVLLAVLAGAPVSAAPDAPVKMSASGLCHDPASPWYVRTKTYVPHETMADCLEEGRAYAGYESPASGRAQIGAGKVIAATPGPSVYDRDLYGHGWTDRDKDCLDVRHELLAAVSSVPVTLDDDGCLVRRGRWIDPYSGRIFLQAGDLDVDHVVPLAWAHERGARKWSPEIRVLFANDARNLFAVSASLNRSKGARGPLEWLPPRAEFHCGYVLRFQRIVKLYDLEYAPGEASAMTRLRNRVCENSAREGE